MSALVARLLREVRRLRAAYEQLLARPPEAAATPLWQPLPGPRSIAYQTPADVTGYGGAAGGGKTDLALGLAITAHRHSLILRREAVHLRAIQDRAREILGRVGRYNESRRTWRELPGGRQIEFGGCKDPGDEHAYQGRPHDLLVFDEASQFPERMVRFIAGWLRTTVPGQRCRLLLCFNPPSSAEGDWLLQFFAPWIDDTHPRPAQPAELRWYAMLDGQEVERPDGAPFEHRGETIQPKSRTFVPARLIDNPHLLATDYDATLQALPEPLRSQLLYGDFTIGRQDGAWQVIPTAWVRAAQQRWTEKPPAGQALTCIGVDVAYGGADATVIAPRYGAWFGPLQKYRGADTDSGPKAAHLVLRAHDGTAKIHVDAIGYGASCYDCLRDSIGKLAVAINVAAASEEFDRTRKYRLTNVRAAMYWRLREALDPESGDELMLPPDPELLADLTAAQFEVRASGIVVEPKDKIKERLGRSPDCADALALALYRERKYKLDVYLG